MKVLHINLQKGWRGGEQQLGYLMLELQKRSVKQVLVCRKDSELEKFAKENNINYFGKKKGLVPFFQSLKKLKEIVLEEQINIIHCHESKGHSLGVYSKILYGFKSKIVLHRKVVFPIKGFLSKKIKYSDKYIAKTICISNVVKTIFEKSTENKNTVIIPDMVDLQFDYTEKQQILRKKYNVPQKTIIGYIAALTFEKDHFTFLDTAKKLLEKSDNLHFVLVGDGDLKEEITSYASSLKIEQYITFTGYIENAKQVIPEIDILLFTSTQEGLGSTVLDFFVAKKPVVTVKNGGSEDLVTNGQTGFLCEIKDSECLAEKTMLLLNDKNLTEQITENAYRKAVENFSIQSVTDRIYSVYREVLAN